MKKKTCEFSTIECRSLYIGWMVLKMASDTDASKVLITPSLLGYFDIQIDGLMSQWPIEQMAQWADDHMV